MTRNVYTFLLYLLLPFTPLKLFLRARKQPEYLQHWRERYGFYVLSALLASKPIIWLHCVSVGETRAAAPLIKALLQQYPQHQILLSHTTPTGRAASEQLFGNSVLRVYLPYDVPFAVGRFLKHFKPVIGILMETELWFNLIAGCKQQNIPLLLVNARLSEKSALGYAKLGNLVRVGLQNLSYIAAQTQHDAERLQQLGATHVQVAGNLKFDVMPPANAIAQGQHLRQIFGTGRIVLIAASMREGEEALVLDAVIAAQIPNLLTVIVPRHPQRFNEVEALLQQRGLTYEKRSNFDDLNSDTALTADITKPKTIKNNTQFILGDSMGELFSYYASADICLVGGSLLPYGGQNLIEAMRMGKPVIIGEHTFNFSEVSALAVSQGAAYRVTNTLTLTETLQTLVNNTQKQVEMGAIGLALCQAAQGATQRTLSIIAQSLVYKA